MSLNVVVRLTGQAAKDAAVLFYDIQKRHNASPIAYVGRNLRDIENDHFRHSEETLQEWKQTYSQEVSRLKLDQPATRIRQYGKDEDLLHHATALYPSIFLDALSKEPVFYGYYPLNYLGNADIPEECEVLSKEDEHKVGNRLFAGGWNNPPGILHLPEHGIALPADFDPSAPNILTSDTQKDAKIYAVEANDPAYLAYRLAHDFWEANFTSLTNQISTHAHKIINAGGIKGAEPSEIHPQMMTRSPQNGQPIRIELSFKPTGFGHLSHGSEFDAFDIVISDNRSIIAFHERTEEAKGLKQLAESITEEPEFEGHLGIKSSLRIVRSGEHIFAYQADGKGTEMDKLGYKQVPLALYQWLGMEAQNADGYEKLPPRDTAFYTMYNNSFRENNGAQSKPPAPALM